MKLDTRMNIATMLAATLGSLKYMPDSFAATHAPKQRKPVPTMVVSPREEIAAWNKAVEARKPVKPSKLHRKATSSRQIKRALYLNLSGYADKHPTIAARYGF